MDGVQVMEKSAGDLVGWLKFAFTRLHSFYVNVSNRCGYIS